MVIEERERERECEREIERRLQIKDLRVLLTCFLLFRSQTFILILSAALPTDKSHSEGGAG